MGYSTYFKGTLKFTKPLTAEEELALQEFCSGDFDIRDHLGLDNSEKECGEYVSYINYQIEKNKSGIAHNGSEKSYGDVGVVNFILRAMKAKFPDFGLKGGLVAQGEEVGDVWKLLIKEGKAIREEIKIDMED